MTQISVSDYLQSKGLSIQDKGAELIARCIFNDCDKDSHGNEAHLYINAQTGQYQCKKCGAEGNLYTIMKHFGDDPKEQNVVGYAPEMRETRVQAPKKEPMLSDALVEKCNKNIPVNIREYLNKRGITDEMIEERKIGYGSFYNDFWIVIPVYNANNELLFLRLRRDPASTQDGKYKVYPSGGISTSLYGEEHLVNNTDYIFICEGEFDQMILMKHGYLSITGTGGAGTFKDEWVGKLTSLKEVYVCFDNDDAGKQGAERLANKIKARFPHISVKNITIPSDKGKDVTDYFLNGGTSEDLTTKYCESTLGVKPGDFPPMYTQEIIEILSDTIKHDDYNKVLVFLAFTSVFTDESQINVLLNSPSSTGKTYIPLQVAQYFPEESIMELQYVSQNAFFHEKGEYDKETNTNHIFLANKIIIFLDQPKSELLARLRPLLSHDKKKLESRITDKDSKGGNKTKNIVIHGYPVVIFCTACPTLDEQEATRFILLSPETTQEKLSAAITSRIAYESNKEQERARIAGNTERQKLKERLVVISDMCISDVIIEDTTPISDSFLKDNENLLPRDQRDVVRVMSIVKAFTLLNFNNRRREGDILYATKEDILAGLELWKVVGEGQKLGVSPYLMDFFNTVLIPAYREVNCLDSKNPWNPPKGILRKVICKKHLNVKGSVLSETRLRQEIEPALENAGLIHKEMDGRSVIISPLYNEDEEDFKL